MKLRLQYVVLAALTMNGCAVARVSAPAECQTGTFTIEEAVLRGLATPDDLIVRVPVRRPPVPALVGGQSILEKLRNEFSQFTVDRIIDNLLILRLKPGNLTLEEKARLLQDAGIQLDKIVVTGEEPEERRTDVVSQPEVINSATASIDEPRRTLRAEANLIMQALATPGDAGFASQCGLKAVNAEKAWDTISRAPRVKVAIVDSGLADRHVDLDPYALPASATDVDSNGHGTHVAGMIGALKDDATGIVGVTWQTDITAYRFLDASGRGTLEEALLKIKAAISGGAHIVVLAWGVGAYSPELFDTIKNADKVLFVAAAGNFGQDTCKAPVFPAAYELDNLISVMATTCDDLRPRFSSYSAKTVDLAAPGEGLSKSTRIYSTVLNQKWGNLAGTSMSAAFVAGAAALVLEPSLSTANPHSPKQIKCWLNATATDLLALKGKCKSEGRLDLAAAVQPLNAGTCPP